MHYLTAQTIISKSGNNSLSYNERMGTFGKAEITLPRLTKINSVQQVKLGEDIRIEEIDQKGVLHSETGLAHIYHISKSPPLEGGCPKDGGIYIMDNHNHALYFRIQYINNQTDLSPSLLRRQEKGVKSSKADLGGLSLLHIDQHSDLNSPKKDILDYLSPNENKKSELSPSLLRRQEKGVDAGKAASGGLDLDLLRRYTNFQCQISNFIKPFLSLYPQTDFNRIKSESQLLESQVSSLKSQIFVLDIDLDFRAPEMNIEKFDETIGITRQLIAQADLVTIATSPLFLDQQEALHLLHLLLM